MAFNDEFTEDTDVHRFNRFHYNIKYYNFCRNYITPIKNFKVNLNFIDDFDFA